MSKKGSVKNIIIVILCVTIIAMGIGFMFLSMKLEDYRNEQDIFDVHFKSVHLLSSIKGGEKNPSGKIEIEPSGKIIQLDFEMFHEHDEIDYEVTIKNEGTLEANIVSLFSSPDFKSQAVIKEVAPIVISISDLSGKILEPGEETTIKISVIYNPVENPTTKNKPHSLSGKIGIITESQKES